VEGDEDLLAAARREILEESGYKNVKYVKHIGGLIESHYFASHKGENRKALFQGLMFELENEERAEISEAEKAVHEPVWLSWEELAKDKNIKCSEYETWLDRLFKPPHAFAEEGVLIDSGEFTGRRSEEVRSAMAQKFGEPTTTFKLRDWIFSRQRYWGEPIPLVHCAKCGWQAVPDKDLPVKLPKVKNYQPTETGESPLAALEKWIKTKCPSCGGPARRETDVMPNWAGSSWYYLRYTDPKNKRAFADAKKITYWTPVNWYNGGMEHTTLHLLYSRFWHKFFYDQKLVPTDEPYAKRTSHGLILAGDGEKMSKSRGNVVNPDEIVERFGADSLRLYELFMGPFNQAIAWSTDGLVGTKRFLERVWRLAERLHFSRALPASGLRRDSKTEPLRPLTNQTIKKVGEDIEGQKFNTAVSALMILTNELEKAEVVNKADYEALLRLLAPFAPHLTEELWAKLGHKKSIHLEPWLSPAGGGESLAQTVIIQVNGVTRGQVELEPSASEAAAVAAAKNAPRVADHLAGKELKRVIYRPGRVINFVV
jgi:leucyl-tRNA synthetase